MAAAPAFKRVSTKAGWRAQDCNICAQCQKTSNCPAPSSNSAGICGRLWTYSMTRRPASSPSSLGSCKIARKTHIASFCASNSSAPRQETSRAGTSRSRSCKRSCLSSCVADSKCLRTSWRYKPTFAERASASQALEADADDTAMTCSMLSESALKSSRMGGDEGARSAPRPDANAIDVAIGLALCSAFWKRCHGKQAVI
mmetsp:Transcript_87020/g.244002  ORF Transcript_87020/g.244002 Transcript_87020/m.244002 type:complete len:200 (+) Transcript_87020:863-1462(+)